MSDLQEQMKAFREEYNVSICKLACYMNVSKHQISKWEKEGTKGTSKRHIRRFDTVSRMVKLSTDVKAFRMEHSISQVDFAKKIGIPQVRFSLLETCRVGFSEELEAKTRSYMNRFKPEEKIDFSKEIKKYRQQNDLSVIEFAKVLDKCDTTVVLWEAGVCTPRVSTQRKIRDLLKRYEYNAKRRAARAAKGAEKAA